MKKITSLFALTLAFTQAAVAGDLSALGTLSQSEFRTVSEDLGAAFSYKPLSPTIAQGITGFDIGVEVTGTDISRSAAALSKAGASDSSMNTLLVPKVHLHKGLPLGFDIAAFIANIQPINANLFGAEVRYALIDGGLTRPAVGVRGAYTKLNDANQLGFSTRSVDLSVSKGFALLTPYAGIGRVWVESKPNASTLASESFTQGKLFVGVNLNLGLINFALEVDQTGNIQSWGAKLGLRW